MHMPRRGTRVRHTLIKYVASRETDVLILVSLADNDTMTIVIEERAGARPRARRIGRRFNKDALLNYLVPRKS
jgi:hypothetical protein